MLHSAYFILKIINSLKDKHVFVAKKTEHFNKCSGHCIVECVLNMDLQEL